MTTASIVGHTWTIWTPLVATLFAIIILVTFNLVSLSIKNNHCLLRSIFTVIFIVCLIYILITVIERLIWVSCSNYYPKWMSISADKNFSAHDLEQLQKNCHSEFSIKNLDRNITAIRCGYWWPTTKVIFVQDKEYLILAKNIRNSA